jgi:hypothetical protein
MQTVASRITVCSTQRAAGLIPAEFWRAGPKVHATHSKLRFAIISQTISAGKRSFQNLHGVFRGFAE